jgi:hypothetical protein
MGFGAVYSSKYGEAFPLPMFSLMWTNGSNARVDLFLPIRGEFWYLPSQNVEIGLTAKVEGNQYHINPAKYPVTNPQMRYSAATLGPSVNWRLPKGFQLRVDTGMTVLRRFEFFDGDLEQNPLDLKNSGFISARVQFGG